MQLDESVESVNFDQVGTPFNGTEDSDVLDSNPSVIKGLVNVSVQLNLIADYKDSLVEGCVVCETIAANSDILLTYRSTHLNNPPPEFAAGSTMKVITGSWVHVPSPYASRGNLNRKSS